MRLFVFMTSTWACAILLLVSVVDLFLADESAAQGYVDTGG